MSTWIVLLHVACAFWFVCGLVGRDVTNARVRAVSELSQLETLMEMVDRFDRWMVQPGSFAVLGAGLLAMWVEHIPLFGASSRWLLVALLLYLSLVPLVPLVFLPKGRIYEEALEEARSQGVITEPLRATLNDRTLRLARAYEAGVVALIIVLMVTKPF